MNKQEYVNTLIKLYRLANMADADTAYLHPDHASWMPHEFSRTHCNPLYEILSTMLTDEQLDQMHDYEDVIV
jgi:hypothetical protein